MKEVFHYSHTDLPDGTVIESGRPAEPEISLASGVYRDPDPNVVAWINNKFKDPDDNVKATLMKAFEWAGIVKTIKDIDGLTKPLEQTGTLPPTTRGDKPPDFSVSTPHTNEFIDRREEQLFLELQEGNNSRNNLLERVKTAAASRHLYSETEEGDLVRFIQEFRKQAPDFTPAYRILRVMIGMIEPADPRNALKSTPLPETRTLVPDIYFMLLKEELETKSEATPAVA